ncbi:MAG: dockerin type I repeat-containing protein [Prevotella sp.]|nr:dockerin type I repeat-containing protein [Prevotella sp.]
MRIDNIRTLRTSSYRRCLRVTLLFFVILLFAVSQLRAEDKIVIPTLKIEPGTTQRLAFQLINKTAYTAFQAEVFLPKGITPAKTGDGNYSVSLSSSRITNHTITANVISSGALKVAAYSSNNENLKGSSGDLFYIDIVSDANFEGSATIEVKGILFTRSSDRKEIEFADASGVATTRISIEGDANSDEAVDAKDIVEVANYLKGSPSDYFDFSAADVNTDGTISIADIIKIVHIILSK